MEKSWKNPRTIKHLLKTVWKGLVSVQAQGDTEWKQQEKVDEFGATEPEK